MFVLTGSKVIYFQKCYVSIPNFFSFSNKTILVNVHFAESTRAFFRFLFPKFILNSMSFPYLCKHFAAYLIFPVLEMKHFSFRGILSSLTVLKIQKFVSS